MQSALIERGIPSFFALLGAALLALWVLSYLRAPLLPDRPLDAPPSPAGPGSPPTARADTAKALPPAVSAFTSAPAASGNGPRTGAVSPPPMPGLWPGFRGPARDNVGPEDAPLAANWSERPPRMCWTVDLGEGYAGPAVRNSRVFLLDYDQAAQADSLRCFALADGRELWRRSYQVLVKRNHGMSRTVPAVSDQFVVSMGPKCHVLCAETSTGKVRWFKDLVREFGATVPEWYAGQCPLIDGSRVILAPGGQALLVAIDLATGKLVWKTPNPRGWTMTHSSIVPASIAGRRAYVYCGSGGVAGVSADDGSLLWECLDWTINTATVPSPVPLGDGRVFLTGGYGSGSLMLKVDADGDSFTVRSLFRLGSDIFGSEQQTPVLYRDRLYGVASGGQMVCLDLKGKRLWTSGSEVRFGLGPFLIAAGKILALDDRGTLSMIDARPSAFTLRGQVRILEGPDAWAPLALAGSRLLARDMNRMVCLDIGRG